MNPIILLIPVLVVGISSFIEDNDVSGLDFVLPEKNSQITLLKRVVMQVKPVSKDSPKKSTNMPPGTNVTVSLTGTGGRCLRGTGPEEELLIHVSQIWIVGDCFKYRWQRWHMFQKTSIYVSPSIVAFIRHECFANSDCDSV